MKSFEQFFTEEKLSAEDRNEMDDSDFGIPETRSFPLKGKNEEDTKTHITQAMRMFPHAPAQYKKALARRILSRAKKFGLDTSKWESLKQYQESAGPEDDDTSGTSEFDEYNVNEPDDCYVESDVFITEADKRFLSELQKKNDQIPMYELNKYGKKLMHYYQDDEEDIRNLVVQTKGFRLKPPTNRVEQQCHEYFRNLINQITTLVDTFEYGQFQLIKWYKYNKLIKTLFRSLGVNYNKDRALRNVKDESLCFEEREFKKYTFDPHTDVLIHISPRKNLSTLNPSHCSRDGVIYPKPRIYLWLEKRDRLKSPESYANEYGGNVYVLNTNRSFEVYHDMEFGRHFDTYANSKKLALPVFINTSRPMKVIPLEQFMNNKQIAESFIVESKNDSIHMRPATKADADRMYRWEMESIDKELQKDPKVQKLIREDVEQSIKDTQMIMDGRVTIGMFTACMIDDGEWRYIGEIYLIPSYRGRGIGSGILRKEIEQYPKIRLQVATSNDKAIKLYKSLGFKIVKENKKQKMYLMEYTRDTVQESVDIHDETFYRYEYEGEGIYEALRKQLTLQEWKSFKQSDAAKWLPVPPDYEEGDESFFTKKGKEQFKKNTLPYMKKHLDPSKIRTYECYLNPEYIRYRDEYQVVFNKTKSYLKKSSTDRFISELKRELRNNPVQESTLPKGITLRPAEEKDLPNIIQWKLESINQELVDNPKVIKFIKNDARENLNNTKMIMCDDDTIGVLESCYIDDGEWWYIGEIYLIPEYRGKGIAKPLLQDEIDSHDKLKLKVSKDNDHAIELYKSLGFTISESDEYSYVMILVKDSVQEGVIQNIRNKTSPFEKNLVYHISPEGTLDGQVFKPRVPEYLDKYDPSKTNFEDVEQPRVCFSPSIEGCLNAILVNLGRWKTADKLRDWYVYIPEKPLKEYKHRTTKQLVDEKKVYDANLTKEIWIEEPVRLKQYGVIRIDSVTDKSKRKTVPTTNGETEKRNYYDFKWHWLIKPKVLKDVKYDYSPKEVCKDMVDTLSDYKYGIPENGKIVSGSEHDYDTKWKLQSPEEFEKNRGGICYDYVEFEEGYLDAYGIECKKYYISTDLPGHDTHTFILVDDGHGGYIYPESSFKDVEGVHEAKSIDEILKMVANGFWKINNNKKNRDSFEWHVWEYTGHPKYGSNMKQCMEYYSKGEPKYEGVCKDDDPKPKVTSESAKSDELIPIKGTLSNKYDYLYFGSDKNHMPEVDIDKGPLFVTPFMGLASIFAGSHEIKKAINEKYGHRNYNLSYKEWRLPENELGDVFKTVHVYVEGIPELEPFELEHEGFIHHIFTKDYDTNFYRYDWMSPTREYLIANTDNMKVEFGNVTKCKVRYIVENKSKPIKESFNYFERFIKEFRNTKEEL